VSDDDRWWRERGEPELRGLLLEWDPIGVVHEPDWPQDEYDAFLEPLSERLRGGASAEELTDFLEGAVREQLGLEPDRDREADLARKLAEWRAHARRSDA
jgi:hypothetical protein